jgi:hypothetical protein
MLRITTSIGRTAALTLTCPSRGSSQHPRVEDMQRIEQVDALGGLVHEYCRCMTTPQFPLRGQASTRTGNSRAFQRHDGLW